MMSCSPDGSFDARILLLLQTINTLVAKDVIERRVGQAVSQRGRTKNDDTYNDNFATQTYIFLSRVTPPFPCVYVFLFSAVSLDVVTKLPRPDNIGVPLADITSSCIIHNYYYPGNYTQLNVIIYL